MGFFKSGLKGSMIGAGLGGLALGIIALPFVPVTLGMTLPIAAAAGLLGGGLLGGLLGGAFGLATDDDEKDKDSDGDRDDRIKELEDKLKEREKEKEPGLFSKIFSVIGIPLAILGIGGAAYGGYKWWQHSHPDKTPEGEQKTPVDPKAPAPDAPPPPTTDQPSALISTASVGDVRVAAAGLRGVGNVRDVSEGPDGLATHATGLGTPDRTVHKV